jgi:ABC-2 type transport system ATP-binding protein
MTAKIEAKAVSKRFGAHVALSSFSIEVAPGETFGLIGPNGAGKTTFLRILTGYWLPTSGDVFVDGESVVERPYAVQERLGYACEKPKLYLDHHVDGFLRLMGELRGLVREPLELAVERAVERFSLQEVRRRRIGVLSEPTVGLDPRQQLELRELIQTLGGKHTVLLSTHQLREAETCCDRVALLDRGELIHIATAEELAHGGSLEKLFLEVTRLEPDPA